jgi:hypothetical protein
VSSFNSCFSHSQLVTQSHFWQLKEILPEEYKVISLFADVLPAGGTSPAYPFGGYTINFNVSTRIHRDGEDLRFCVVLVLMDGCEGGDLCILELGLRLTLRHGDLVVFRSDILSHFNLHFKGKRVSIVMQTDKAGMGWVKDRNGWGTSAFMNVLGGGCVP